MKMKEEEEVPKDVEVEEDLDATEEDAGGMDFYEEGDDEIF